MQLPSSVIERLAPFKSTMTLAKIEADMTARGSHWWSPSWLREYKTVAFEPVLKKNREYYFICRETYENDPFRPTYPKPTTTGYCLRKYTPSTNEIETLAINGVRDLQPLPLVVEALEKILNQVN